MEFIKYKTKYGDIKILKDANDTYLSINDLINLFNVDNEKYLDYYLSKLKSNCIINNESVIIVNN